jgi:predicted helicase
MNVRRGPQPVLPLRPLLQAIAEATHGLDCALGAHDARHCAEQTGLLWSFVLLMARGSAEEPSTLRTTRFHELLATIDRACAGWPDVADSVGRLAGLYCPANVQRLLQAAAQSACGGNAWAHLFEQLWAATDANLRRRRGGYFTPEPIVNYIVRSADALVRRDLDLPDGLSGEDESLIIVDPACGSGAFLLGVTQFVHASCTQNGNEATWERMARDVLPRRLVGVDVVPACCRVAEILVEADIAAPWSARCGNLLDQSDQTDTLLRHRLPVIIGNPPYANFGQRNRGRWILSQLEAYKTGLGERKHNLGDDFIKFLRWSQYWIDQAGCGIVAMVTSNTYLEGLTHRQMRASLAGSFDYIHIVDLHGDRKKRECTPSGELDENVFGIQQGVAIGIFVKRRSAIRPVDCRITHTDLWGPRHEKLASLARTDAVQSPGAILLPRAPFHFFVPHRDVSDSEYSQWPRLDQIFEQYVSGVQTKCDALFVGFTREEVEQRMHACLADAARGRFSADLPAWLPRRLRDVSFDPRHVRPYMVAPWDVRWVYYDPRLLGRSRERLLGQMDGTIPALVFMRQATHPHTYDHFLASPVLVSDRVFYSAHGAPFVAPLLTIQAGALRPNFAGSFLQVLEDRLAARGGGRAGARPSFDTHDVFPWIYAQVHSRRYRQRYRHLLSIDFPHIPWPSDLSVFRDLVRLGRRLLTLHCGVAANCVSSPTDVSVCTSAVTVTRPRWSAPDTLWLAPQQPWPEPVEERIWQFQIGGYAVLRRWLQQRAHRALTAQDQHHLQRMIGALRATAQGMEDIDRRSGPDS